MSNKLKVSKCSAFYNEIHARPKKGWDGYDKALVLAAALLILTIII